jgi:hypothetical protein
VTRQGGKNYRATQAALGAATRRRDKPPIPRKDETMTDRRRLIADLKSLSADERQRIFDEAQGDPERRAAMQRGADAMKAWAGRKPLPGTTDASGVPDTTEE